MNLFSPSITPSTDEDDYSGDGEDLLFLETSWFLYAVAACVVLLVFTVFLMIVLLAKKCRSAYKAKISYRSTDCDYDDIADRTIVELFEVLDKRNEPTAKTPSTNDVIETEFELIHSDSIKNSLKFKNQVSPVEVIVNSYPGSPNSVSSVNTQSFTSGVDTSVAAPIILKPLAVKASFIASNESVYDNLEEPEIPAQEVTDGKESTLPNSIYEDTVISPKKDAASVRSPTMKDTIYDDTVIQSPIKEAEYAIPDCGLQRSTLTTDEAGYYILPDNYPPPKDIDYSYSATHNLVPAANTTGEGIGEVRSQTSQNDVSPLRIYTKIDDIPTPDYQNIPSPVHDPTYSNIDETEENYLYACEHMIISPKRSNEGEVVVKPEGHHTYDSINASKSKSLPGHTQPKEPTYANLKESQSVKKRNNTEGILPFIKQAANNPLYGSSDDILSALQIERNNPIYDSTTSQCNPQSPVSNTRMSTESTPYEKEKEYFTSTDAWLKHMRPHSMSTSQSEMTTPLDESDHTYMGIFVRDRVDHDYTVPPPKRMVSFSSDSGVKMPRDQRTYSAGNHKYENQSMWLRNAEGLSNSSLSQNSTSTYMGLYGGSYETNYTIPNSKHTFSHSQV